MEAIQLKEESSSSTANSYNDTGLLEDDKSDYFSAKAAASRDHRGDYHKCPHCSFPFRWAGNLREHVKFYHRKGAPCRHCDKAFETADLLRQHVKKHRGGEDCPSCGLCLGRLSLDLHYAHCSTRPNSSSHSPATSLQGRYEQHATTDDIAVLCWKPICKEPVKQAGSPLVKKPEPVNKDCSAVTTPLYVKTINQPSTKYSSPHLLCSFINSQTPNAGEETSKCPLCAADVYQNTIIAHLIDIHEMSFENVICVYTALNKKFTRVVLCKWCKREFKKSSSCTAHSRCCYRRPTFLNNKCSQCQGLFTTYEEYLAHYCCKEYKFENAQCSACKILLNNLLTFDFKNHEKICTGDDAVLHVQEAKPSILPVGGSLSRGRNIREFGCPRCHTIFHLKSLLDNHLLTCFRAEEQLTSLDQVDDVSQLQHSCPHCGQCFLTATMMAGHSCDTLDMESGALLMSDPIIPLVEPPQMAYRRAPRGRPRGKSRGGSMRRRGRPPGRGRGGRRRTCSESDSDSDYHPEDSPAKKARLANRSAYDNGHPPQPTNEYFIPAPDFTTTAAAIQDMVNSARIQPACRNCDSMLPQHSLLCPACGTDNSQPPMEKMEVEEDKLEPIVIDLDKMEEEEGSLVTTQLPCEDSGVSCHYEDFSYQTINSFHGFVPLNQSHFICSKCFNNVSSLSLLAEHLATKHDLKIPNSLKIGKMKGTFGKPSFI